MLYVKALHRPQLLNFRLNAVIFIPRLHDEAGSTSWLDELARRASCMNACRIKRVWYCKHSRSWLDELW